MADVLEVLMIVCFGLSWPLNIYKAWKARTAKGSSLLFYTLIWVGYLFGVSSKIVKISTGIHVPLYALLIYICNVAMTTAGILIYFRNKALDKKFSQS